MNRPIAPHPVNPARPRPLPSPRPNPPTPPRPQPRPGRLVSTLYLVGACLGAGLAVDRRYPERLWQFVDHRIPDGLFADEAGRDAYADALARAALARPARPGRSRQGGQSDCQTD